MVLTLRNDRCILSGDAFLTLLLRRLSFCCTCVPSAFCCVPVRVECVFNFLLDQVLLLKIQCYQCM